MQPLLHTQASLACARIRVLVQLQRTQNREGNRIARILGFFLFPDLHRYIRAVARVGSVPPESLVMSITYVKRIEDSEHFHLPCLFLFTWRRLSKRANSASTFMRRSLSHALSLRCA